jgi:polysaccharide deacetylase 2 family uncharacterized protein YibQ
MLPPPDDRDKEKTLTKETANTTNRLRFTLIHKPIESLKVKTVNKNSLNAVGHKTEIHHRSDKGSVNPPL